MAQYLSHNFEPVYNEKSRVLILGTFPSVKSRENNFYYAHPQNRFWRLISKLANSEKIPETIEEKKRILLNEGIAIWDVISSCTIEGSSDSSIKNVTPNNIKSLVEGTDIKCIYANGGKAYELYKRYIGESVNLPVKKLPSTSPANAAFSMDRLYEEWKIILDDLKSGTDLE